VRALSAFALGQLQSSGVGGMRGCTSQQLAIHMKCSAQCKMAAYRGSVLRWSMVILDTTGLLCYDNI
jgi:hypothetical protein